MMVSMTDPASRAADPTTSHEELYELAGDHPELRPLIAENPNTYPELVDWLASLGDPQIDAALRRRGDATQTMPASGGAAATQAMPPLHADTGTFQEHVRAQDGAPEDESAYYPAAPMYPAAAAYPAAAQQQPAAHWAGYAAPEHAGQERAERRRGGAGCCLFIVMGIVLVAAVAAALFLLPLQLFGDDDEPQQDNAAEQAPEEAQEGEQAPEEDSADQDEAGDEEAAEDEARPAPEDATEMSAFSAPSENIHCEVGGDSVSCTIEEYNFDAPEDCDGPVTVTVGEDGEAQTSCGGTVSSQPSQLDYGQSAASGDFACTSSQAGFECWNTQTGNGFFMARESIDLQ
ncbi:hypothetical protein GCM10009618_03860 [Nesterenkonia lacusekhoensis]|nr:hypothetical protein [Nesterenkonia lacusekhoensis]